MKFNKVFTVAVFAAMGVVGLIAQQTTVVSPVTRVQPIIPYDGNSAHYLDGSGKFSTPAGSGGSAAVAAGTNIVVNTNAGVSTVSFADPSTVNSVTAGAINATVLYTGLTNKSSLATDANSAIIAGGGGGTLPTGIAPGDVAVFNGTSWVDSQIGSYLVTGTSINSTATNLIKIPVTNNYTAVIKGNFTAAGSTNSGTWDKTSVFRNVAGTMTINQSNAFAVPITSDATNWNVLYNIADNTNIAVQVIGPSTEIVNWKWQGWFEQVTNAIQPAGGCDLSETFGANSSGANIDDAANEVYVYTRIVPGSTYTVCGLAFYMSRTGANPFTWTAEIRGETSGNPGTVLASSASGQGGSSVSTSLGFVTNTITSPITLTSGTPYWVGLHFAGSSGSQFYVMRYAATGTYLNSSDNSTWVTNSRTLYCETLK